MSSEIMRFESRFIMPGTAFIEAKKRVLFLLWR